MRVSIALLILKNAPAPEGLGRGLMKLAITGAIKRLEEQPSTAQVTDTDVLNVLCGVMNNGPETAYQPHPHGRVQHSYSTLSRNNVDDGMHPSLGL